MPVDGEIAGVAGIEFGTNDIIALDAQALGADLPVATWAVTAYAIGVVVGSPAITVGAARLNRKIDSLVGKWLNTVGSETSRAAAIRATVTLSNPLVRNIAMATSGPRPDGVEPAHRPMTRHNQGGTR